ncbi:hypothetical protein LJR164_002544 [Phenylobacterium sp. LjRoot164]|uniref:hypothetical protein n=1 Tax=unclassified Phenylobacterium TaxID=2640670 RepID=UPI003ECDCC37
MLRSEAGVVAGQLAGVLALDATDQISLNLALLGDYRHAKTLATRLLGAGVDWSIDPSPEGLGGKQRAARFTVTIGQARAIGSVPALVLLAAVLRRSA